MTQESKMLAPQAPEPNGAAAQDTATADIPLAEQITNTRVHWDDSKMVTTFANVVNVLTTREEVTLLFGINQTWNAAEIKELSVGLSNRLVLTPYAAKRLLILLTARMRDYEARIGPLPM